jgi:hypothetical protein
VAIIDSKRKIKVNMEDSKDTQDALLYSKDGRSQDVDPKRRTMF